LRDNTKVWLYYFFGIEAINIMDPMVPIMEIVQGKFQHCPFIIFPPKSGNLKIAILVI
jgi:hypothetical protein